MSGPGHSHSSHGRSVTTLRIALAAVIAVAGLEVMVGSLAHSLALVSDAGHLGTDAATLGLSWYALARSRRPATSRHTYGFHRTGIVVAGLNGFILFAIAAFIAVGAAGRLQHPEPIEAVPVILVATIALVVNAGLAVMLRGGARDLSVRSALFHAAADAMASVGVIVAAIVVLTTGWQQADAVVSLGIAVLIGIGAAVLLREAGSILSEAVPRDLDGAAVRACIAATPGVTDVHDLHIWALDRSHRALSAHVAVADQPLTDVTRLLVDLEVRLCAEFGIEHATLQPECPPCVDDATAHCNLDERHAAHLGAARHV